MLSCYLGKTWGTGAGPNLTHLCEGPPDTLPHRGLGGREGLMGYGGEGLLWAAPGSVPALLTEAAVSSCGRCGAGTGRPPTGSYRGQGWGSGRRWRGGQPEI